MPRNGAGVYSLPSGINPVVTQTLITSNWANTTMADIANALTGSVARDGQSPMTGNLNMGGFQVINLGAPTTASSAVSLGMVQSGAQWRLTNVAGSANQITASLPGNIQTVAVGQFVELIPAANNTGPVTVNINGIGFQPVSTQLGNPLAANNLQQGKPYILLWDGAQWLLCFSPNANAFAQSAISGWDRPANGIYPLVTKVDNSTVSVPAGKGRIVAPGTRDQSGLTEVSWVLQNVSLTGMLNAWCTTIAVDALGHVVQLAGPLQASWARTYIILATVGHVDGKIESIVNQPSIYGDIAYEAYDLGNMFQNTIMSGGQLTTSANPMHLEVHAGRMWLMGGNANQANQPNFVDFADQLDITVWPVTANNTVGAAVQTIPVTQYDPAGAGALATIPDPPQTCVIHRVFLMAGQYVFVYGQIAYSGLAAAIQNLNLDNAAFKPPGKLQGATLFGYVIAQKNCNNLGDGVTGQIIGPNAAAAGGGGGGGVTEAPLSGLAYARRNAAWNEAPYYAADGTVMVGHNADAFNGALHVNAAPGYSKSLLLESSGLVRWSLASSNGAEAGANAGSDFSLNRYADSGANLSTSFAINRATGQISLPDGLVLVGADNLGTPGRVWIDAAAGQQKKVQFQSAGKARWEIGSNNDAETGSNAGSSFYVQRFDDTGAVIDQPFWIDRKLGKITYSLAAGQQPNFTLLGNGSSPQLTLNIAAPGTSRYLAGRTNDLNRWYFTLGDATAEGGANAGSNFTLSRCNDAGARIDDVIFVTRSTGNVTLSQGLTVTAGIVSNGTISAAQNFVSSTPNLVLAPTNPGTIYLRPNGPASATGQVSVGPNGVLTAGTASQTTTLSLTDTGTNGCGIGLFGSGSNPNKYIRAASGNLDIINNGYSAVMGSFKDFGGTAFSFNMAGGVYPTGDNAFPLGAGGTRWTVVWAVTGTINTCDVREKDIIGPNELGLALVKAVPVSRFKYKVGHNDITAVVDDEGKAILDENGQFQTVSTPVPGTRTHISGMAQDVVAQLQAAGLDPSDSAIWALDDPNDPDSRQGLRTEQLLWVLWTAVQELSKQVEALQAK